MMETNQIQVLTETFEGHAQKAGNRVRPDVFRYPDAQGRTDPLPYEDAKKMERRLVSEEKKSLKNPDTLE